MDPFFGHPFVARTRYVLLLVVLLTAILAVQPASADEAVIVTVSPDKPGDQIPTDFLGLSYQSTDLAQDYFESSNTAYVQLLTTLGQGILRFGGSAVELTYWGNVTPTKPNPKDVTLKPADLDRMLAFAQKAGWGVILGVNLGDYQPQMAADEAAYALQQAKSSIVAIEIGNEPDAYPKNGLRPSNWGVADLSREFSAYVTAIRAESPSAPIAGPVTSGSTSWFKQFLDTDSADVTLATHHIYAVNSALDPSSQRYASIPNLLSTYTSNRISAEVATLTSAATAHQIRVRIAETNSVDDANGTNADATRGGKDGVSNVFASALWGTDYLFMLASHGITGVNMHGNLASCKGFTPICMTGNQQFQAQPLYYAMLLFHLAADGGQLVPTTIQTSANVTAYAVLGTDKSLRVVLINKTADQPVTVQLNLVGSYSSASALRLTASALDAESGITLGGSAVAADGTWTPTASETISRTNTPSGNGLSVSLPAASAVLLTLSSST